MEKKYNTIIIGAGNIGALLDEPSSDRILSHAHAFSNHKGFILSGFIDINKSNAQKAVSIWGGKVYSNIEEAFNLDKIDVVSVTVPDEEHYSVLKNLSKFSFKLILGEKPLAKTLSEAQEIREIYEKKNIPVAVNYSRRFVPEVQTIREHIVKGVYGNYITGTGYYGKGIIHNGSHLIDLLRYFKLEVKKISFIDSVSDFYDDDKSISAVLTFENNRQFYLQYVDCRLYTIFELDLLFEKGRIIINDLGFKIEEYDIQEDKIFKGYRKAIKTCEINTSLDRAIYFAVDNIYKYLTEEEKLKCTIEDGYKALEICMKIRDSVNNA